MRKCIFLTALTVFVDQISYSAPLTFEDAWKIARSTSLDLKRRLNQVDIQKAETDITLEQDSAVLTLQSQAAVRSARSQVGKNKVNTLWPFVPDIAVSASITRNIYDFGKQELSTKKAQLRERVAESEIDASSDALFFKVARSYLKASSISAQLTEQKHQTENAYKRKVEIEKIYKFGGKSQFDITKAEADELKTKLAEERSQAEWDSAINALRSVINSKEPVEPLPLPLRSALEWEKILTETRGHSLQSLPQDKKFQTSLASLDLDSKLIQISKYPLVNVGAGVQANLASYVPAPPTLFVQLQLNWQIPLSDSENRELDKIAFQRRDLLIENDSQKESRLEARFAAEEASRLALHQLRQLQKHEALLQKLYQLSFQRYKSGKSTVLELVQAADDLTTVRLETLKVNTSLATLLLDIAEAIGEKNVGHVFQ